MGWQGIIGQNRVIDLLQKAILNDKVAHAYCFSGNEGVGKEAVAIAFSKVLNCEKPTTNDNVIEACNECSGCKMANKLQHPNINIIHSLPAIKGADSRTYKDKMSDDLIEEIKFQFDKKANNLYEKVKLAKATQIKIASIRELKKNLTMSSNYEGRQFIIIFDAEQMTNEASNAFLKTLEEPQSNVTIIMCTSKPELILQTIMSRCQQIHFPPLGNNELAEFLKQKFNLETSQALLSASLGQGSYQRAINFLDEDMKQLREDTVDMLRTSLKRIYRLELLEKIQPVVTLKDKNITDIILKILLLWLRDSLSFGKTQNKDLIINQDHLETIINFTSKFGNKNISRVISLIEKACEYNFRNINQQLFLLNLFIEIRRVLLSK